MDKQEEYLKPIGGEFLEEVDLNYTFMIDSERSSVYIKFDGFYDSEQMEQFAEYMNGYLPLIFGHGTKH
jgi:hypothetical protein